MSNWAIIPSDSDVMHNWHKYIEKVRTTKGGWRYIYKRPKYKNNAKNSFGFEERKKLKEQQKKVQEAEAKKKEHLSANEQNRKTRLEQKSNLSNNGSLHSEIERERLHTAQEKQMAIDKENYTKATSDLKSQKMMEYRLRDSYLSTPLGKIESSAKAGAAIISDFIKTFPKMASTKISFLANGSPYNTKVSSSWKRGTNYTPPYTTQTEKTINSINNQIGKIAEDLSKNSVPNRKRNLIIPYNEIPVIKPRSKKKRMQS